MASLRLESGSDHANSLCLRYEKGERSLVARALFQAVSPVAQTPKVVIVVLNWNGWPDTVECVESILRADYSNIQIVICDNGSGDGSAERLREWADGTLEVESAVTEGGHRWAYRPVPKPLPYAQYTRALENPRFGTHDPKLIFVRVEKNLGYAGGNNIGLEYALAQPDVDYVWILNNDTVVERDTLARMVASAEGDSRIGVVGSTLLHYRSPHAVQALGGGRFSRFSGRDHQIGRGRRHHTHATQAFDLEHVVGASMLVRTATIREVGLIEESYFLYREETDWCIQMRQRNWRLRYCPGAVVWHKEGRSIGHKSYLHDYYSVRNMLFLMQKFYPKNLPLAILFLASIAIPPKVCRLQFKRLKYVLKAFSDFFRGIQGSGDMLPDFDALAIELASRTSQHEMKIGLREKLAGAELRKIKRGQAGAADTLEPTSDTAP